MFLDIDLPKKSSEVGVIRRMFLDPSASHLIITTANGENYYLHTQSRQPKPLSRLKGVLIECIAWNPSLPTASTREILLGTQDGKVYEAYIEPSNEFYRREEKYLKAVYEITEGLISGLWVGLIPDKPFLRRVLVASQNKLYYFQGQIGRHGSEGSGSIYTKLFEAESPGAYEVEKVGRAVPSVLTVSPDPAYKLTLDNLNIERSFAWLSGQGILYGNLGVSSINQDVGNSPLNESRMFSKSRVPPSSNTRGRRHPIPEPIAGIVMSQWHILCLVEGRIMAVSRLDERIVYDQIVLEPGQKAIGLLADQKKNTFWLFTTQEILEIVVTDEDRDVWKVMLKEQKFESALQYARGALQKDAVAIASGDYLISKHQYSEAAVVYGRSSKPFEQVALKLIDDGEQDALRRYLLAKLGTLKKAMIMQRVMIASWLIEIFMSKLNSLDDTITTNAELAEDISTAATEDELTRICKEFQDFVTKYKGDLDKKTTYEIIDSHGREQELLSYATAVNDYSYILAYWVQREKWRESLDVLKKQTDPAIFYRYSSVLMAHVATELVDVWMRHPDLNPRNLVPALLIYNEGKPVPLAQNQAARYLLYCINNLHSTDAAIHNALISIYASDPSPSESALLSYLSDQSLREIPAYDADFALRLCVQHSRVQSCVHIYSSMGQYISAVALALKHNEIDLASTVADRPSSSNIALRKRLWLAVAKKVISQQATGSIKTALDFLKRCELLRIEDLIPFFPDFVVIDDFKEEICAALESYSRHIDALKTEMEDSAATAESIKSDIKGLDKRYVLVEAGERCRVCELPLLSRQFFVFPSCQHGFHSDCLGNKVMEGSGLTIRGRIRELQESIRQGVRKDKNSRELDGLVAKEW